MAHGEKAASPGRTDQAHVLGNRKAGQSTPWPLGRQSPQERVVSHCLGGLTLHTGQELGPCCLLHTCSMAGNILVQGSSPQVCWPHNSSKLASHLGDFWLSGDQGAAMRLARGGRAGGSAELGEATGTGFQTGHGAPGQEGVAHVSQHPPMGSEVHMQSGSCPCCN